MEVLYFRQFKQLYIRHSAIIRGPSLAAVHHPETGRDVLVMAVKLAHHKGKDSKPRPEVSFVSIHDEDRAEWFYIRLSMSTKCNCNCFSKDQFILDIHLLY